MKKTTCFLSIIFLFLTIHSLSAQMVERKNTGAMLELEGKMWHGAGQAGTTGFDGFENYWNIAPKDQKPNIFMDYYDTWNMNEHWYIELKQEILKYHRQGYYVIPQFGINIFYLWREYANTNTQDDELDNLVKGLRHLAIPCFIRVGYEWNNYPQEPWMMPEYTPEELIRVFKKICGKLKAAKDLEIATVWNIGLSGWLLNHKPMMDYWPGKEYMDWMSFNPFESDISGGTHCYITEMCDHADSLGLPVLIGEASPNFPPNDPTNYKDWDKFFDPYLNVVLATQPTIKQMCYINWDWECQDMVGGNGLFPWGDSRLQHPDAKETRDKWFKVLEDNVMLHACSEKETRSYFKYDDNEAPPSVKIRREGKYIVWDGVKDRGEADLAHYTIYKDGKLWDYIITPKYPVKDLYNGNKSDVEVTAMDRAGNESEKSNKLRVDLDKSMELLWDGGFDYPATSQAVDWRWMGTMDGDAKTPPDDIYIDTTSKITGKNSCWLPDKQELVGENYNWWRKIPERKNIWMVQLFQAFQVQANETYTIKFKALAREPRTIKVAFMDHHPNPDHTFQKSDGTGFPMWDPDDPKVEWEYYKLWDAEITTEVKEFTFQHTVKETECARLSFMFGHVEPTEMWFDDISVLAGDTATSIVNESTNPDNLKMQLLPNPGYSLTRVKYTLMTKSNICVNLYNGAGKLMRSVSNKKQAAGTHSVTLNTANLSSGVYFVKINAGSSTAVKYLMIVR